MIDAIHVKTFVTGNKLTIRVVYFIGEDVTQKSMVSRSLEKMMLIAIGLSTAVIVGVPILLYSMNTLQNASHLEIAQVFAVKLHNETERVDNGATNETSFQVNVPSGISMNAVGTTLTITLEYEGIQTTTWSETYDHTIVLNAPETSGIYIVTVRIVSDVIEISFSLLT